MATIAQLIISVMLAAFFSSMEIAFASTDKLRFEMGKKDNLTTRILTVFYNHPKDFISTMMTGYIASLAVFSILTANFMHGLLDAKVNVSPAFTLILEIIAASAVLLALGEFMPKTLAKANSRFMIC